MKSKRKYYSEKLLQFQGDTKKTWRIMNNVIGKSKLIHLTWPRKIIFNKNVIFDEKRIGNSFNNFFINIGPKLADDIPTATKSRRCSVKKVFPKGTSGLKLYLKRNFDAGVFLWILRNFEEHLFLQNTAGGCFWISFESYVQKTNETIKDEPITNNERKDVYFFLKVNKSAGYDEISFNFIKNCFGELYDPLKRTLMQNWKSLYRFGSILNSYLENFAFLILINLELFTQEVFSCEVSVFLKNLPNL